MPSLTSSGDLPLKHVAELGPGLLALVQLLELAERLHVVGLAAEDLLPQLDRDRRLLELLRGQLRDLDAPELLRVLVGQELDLALVDADELLPVAPLLVHLLEEAERLAVVGVELED